MELIILSSYFGDVIRFFYTYDEITPPSMTLSILYILFLKSAPNESTICCEAVPDDFPLPLSFFLPLLFLTVLLSELDFGDNYCMSSAVGLEGSGMG